MPQSVVKTWSNVNLDTLSQVAKEVKESVETPCLIMLSGEVGVGKTTFTRAFVQIKDEDVYSPTYSIINDYGDTIHADFYRLKNVAELEYLELELYLEDSKYFLAEWSDEYLSEIQEYLDESFQIYQLKIEIFSDQLRKFTLLRHSEKS